VEGFLHWATDELGSLSSVQRAKKEEGAPQFWALLFLVLVARLVRSLLCIQVPLYFITCCISCFNHNYIDIYLKLVFPGGVLSRVMLTKNTCVKFMHVLKCRSAF
jgi:hypothetical protein